MTLIIMTLFAVLTAIFAYKTKKNIDMGDLVAATNYITLTAISLVLWIMVIMLAPQISAIFDNLIIDIS